MVLVSKSFLPSYLNVMVESEIVSAAPASLSVISWLSVVVS